MNRPGFSLLVCHLSLAGLYFAGISSGNDQRIKKVYGVVKKDVTITCKYAEFSLKPTLEPRVNPDNSSWKLAELQIVKWRHYDHPKDQKNVRNIVLGDRFSSSSTGSSFTAQLRIKELQVTDAGFYVCIPAFIVKGAVAIEPDVTQLLFKAVPIGQIILKVPQLEVKKAATLSLRAIGFYPKQIMVDWLKDEIQLREGVRLSVITNSDGTFSATSTVSFVSQINDHGKTITCWITHKSEKTSKSQKLQVSYGPVGLRVEPKENTTKMTGDLLELTCVAHSNPTAEMTWRLDRKVLLRRVTNRLRIRVENVSSSDQGTYICSAKNELGTRQAMVVVTVIERPITHKINNRLLLVIVISVSAVPLLIVVTSIVSCVIVRKCRASGRQEEEPVYMVSSQPTADVYDTLKRDDPEEPSAQQKASDGIYENIYRARGYNPTTA